jgi:hypothetical protein
VQHPKLQEGQWCSVCGYNPKYEAKLAEAYTIIEMCGDCCTQDADECLERLKESEPVKEEPPKKPAWVPKEPVTITDEEMKRCHELGCEFAAELQRRFKQMSGRGRIAAPRAQSRLSHEEQNLIYYDGELDKNKK